jgi:Lar family restriction alleviation protein
MTVDLKPCPFCDSPVLSEYNDGDYHVVQCAQCGAEVAHTIRHKLVAAWNRRAEPKSTEP